MQTFVKKLRKYSRIFGIWLRIPSKFFSDLLPYLSQGFCTSCKELLESRLQHINHDGGSLANFCSADSSNFWTPEKTSASSTQLSTTSSTPASVNSTWSSIADKVSVSLTVTAKSSDVKVPSDRKRMSQVGRKKDFVCVEKINGKPLNVLQGLELYTRVFNDEDQKEIVEYVYNLQRLGQSRKFRERTYTEPRKWMRGKGRVTIHFVCCYNYAVSAEVDPIPFLFKSMIRRMVKWRILPSTCIPNSCIVNIYDEGDCIPPHIDHHDLVRPFCTVSFLTEANILFGSNLKVVAHGEFSGPASIPLPVGSVLILQGNGADVAKHCVPAVPGKRISITFRKMDDSKLPFKFSPDPELQHIQPLGSSQTSKLHSQQVPLLRNLHHHNGTTNTGSEVVTKKNVEFGELDFPPLGASSTANWPRSRIFISTVASLVMSTLGSLPPQDT
ncbi:mRNA N(6)-methyladenine demethylase [Ranunculus cassubicifolius]